MLLPDTSAWIEYLRATGSETHLRLRAAIRADEPLATTGPVVMEILGGARRPPDLASCRAALAACVHLPIQDPDDYEAAAAIYRACRRGGDTVRRYADCLIATVAIREDAELLHCDRDYDVIARHLPLRLA